MDYIYQAQVMNWYDEFECPGGDCGLTCCSEEWRIGLTDEEIKKYEAIEGPFGDFVRDNIDYSRKSIKCNNGTCNLLNDKGYCELYINCGEEYLSQTCTNFPRRVNICGNIGSFVVDISCPLVSKRLFKKDEITFSEKTATGGEYTIGVDEDYVNSLLISRNALMAVVDMFPGKYLHGKMFILAKVLEGVKGLITGGCLSVDSVNTLLEKYCDDTIIEDLLKQCEPMRDMVDAKAKVMHRTMKDLIDLSFVNIMLKSAYTKFPYLKNHVENWLNDFELFKADLVEYTETFSEEYPLFAERYLIYVLFTYWMSSDKHSFGNDIASRIIELFVFQVYSAAMWKENGKIIDERDMSVLIASIDRSVSHHKALNDNLVKYYEKILDGNIINLIMLTFG